MAFMARLKPEWAATAIHIDPLARRIIEKSTEIVKVCANHNAPGAIMRDQPASERSNP